jgi:hypothetical protein
MKKSLTRMALVACAVMISGLTQAQTKPESSSQEETGFTASVEFDGSSGSAEQDYELDASVGYTFTRHFGMDLGVPFYFVNGSAAGSVTGNGLGNPTVDLRWRFPNSSLNYGTVLAGSAPVGDKSLGVNTGHATFDWTNHFDHSFNRVTPFVEAGLSNTIADTRLFVRPYTAYGYNSHFRGGAELDVWKSISVGAAGYDIAPFGNQTIIPRGRSNNPHIPSTTITGSSSLAKDDGFSMWVDASPSRYLDAEVGFTRSAHLDWNALSFSIGLNVGHLIHHSQ